MARETIGSKRHSTSKSTIRKGRPAKKVGADYDNTIIIIDEAIKTPFSLVRAAHAGVLARYAFEVADSLLIHQDQLAQVLHVSTRTLRSYKQAEKKLDVMTGEQVLKLRAMQIKGKEILGTPEAFRKWLEKPAHGLEGLTPLTLLQTSEGIDLIIEELDRIAYGDFS